MLITDHINMSGTNVLTGPNEDELGERFTSLRDAYDPELAGRLRDAARELDIELAEGVYLAVSGPSFETAAEIRAFGTLGADAVGMSTVHETIVARHCGLRVAAVSAITNLAEGLSAEPLSHEQTLARRSPGGGRPGSARDPLRRGTAVIAKVELHVHLEGTAPPDLIRRLAERNGLPVPGGLVRRARSASRTPTSSISSTPTTGRRASIRTTEDYRDVTYEYLAGCAREGAMYVELIVSPDHAVLVGLSGEVHLGAIARGIDEARTRPRNRGPGAARCGAQLRCGAGGGTWRATRPPAPTRTWWASTWRATRPTTRPATSRRRSRSPRRRGWAAPSTPASGTVRRACGRRSTCP